MSAEVKNADLVCNNIIKFMDIQDIYKDAESKQDFFDSLKKTGKKIALFYGNCQIKYIEDIATKSVDFCKEYVIIRILPVHIFGNVEKEQGLDKVLLEAVDLFVYQNVIDRQKYGKLITSTVMEQLRANCIKVSIPNVYFNGYHPQVTKNERNLLLGSKYNSGGIAPYGDSVLRKLFIKRVGVLELEKHVYSENCISEKEIIQNLQKTLIELRRREEILDVNISDYIEQNYKQKYLFFTPSHPTNEVLAELVKRIFNRIGLNTEFNIDGLEENDRFELPIYPVVSRILELNFEKETFYFCKTLCNHRDTIAGWALKYYHYCYPELQKAENHQTIDLSDLVEIDEKYLEKRGTMVLTYDSGIAHLSCYLTIKKAIPNLPVIRIPAAYAPRQKFLTAGCGSNVICPIQVSEDGSIKINKPVLDSNILLIDATWHC